MSIKTMSSFTAAVVMLVASPGAAQTTSAERTPPPPAVWADQTPPAQPAQTAPVPPRATTPDARRWDNRFSARTTQAFQVILLVAEMQGTAGTEGLPKSALRALEDLKDFLPFKSYRALDMAWIRTTGSAETRLTGPTGQPYYARLNAHLGENGTRGEKIYVSSFELRDGEGSVVTQKPSATPAPATDNNRKVYELLSGRGGSRIISTSFGMEVGETVVVGTSKITGGDKALVVLLTAVPPAISRQ